MKIVEDYPEKISNDTIERVSKLSTTLLSDAMNGNGAMNYSIQPVSTDMFMIGTAITVDTRPGDNLILHQAIYTGSKEYVLVVDGKGSMDNAYMGDLMARAAKAVGLEGIVIDGAVRDKKDLIELGFPMFSKGFCPGGPYKNGPGSINRLVTCGGVPVKPGDLIMGDSNGVVVVPQEDLKEVINKAESKLSYEMDRIKTIKEYEEKLKNGDAPNSIEPKWLKAKIEAFSTD